MVLFVIISILHVIMSIALILIVLLQTGKGSDIASAFGGGSSQAMFGSRGPASFLNKMTTIAALLFIVTSVSLSYLSIGNNQNSVMGGMSEPAETEEQQPSEGALVPSDEAAQEQSESVAQPEEQSAQPAQDAVSAPGEASSADEPAKTN